MQRITFQMHKMSAGSITMHGGVRKYKQLIRARVHNNRKIWKGFMQSFSVCRRSFLFFCVCF